MNVAALLLVWLSSLLSAAPVDRSPLLSLFPSASIVRDSVSPFTAAVIERPIETRIPRGPSRFGLGAPVWDEEDSLDDLLVDAGLLPCPHGRDCGSDDLSRAFWPQCDLVRSASHAQPLRC
jgi:hypothetical protein